MRGFLNELSGLRAQSLLQGQGRPLRRLGRWYGVLIPLKLDLVLERRRQERRRAKTGGVNRSFIDGMMAFDTRLTAPIDPAEVRLLMAMPPEAAEANKFQLRGRPDYLETIRIRPIHRLARMILRGSKDRRPR